MTVQVSYPGVYVDEVSSANHSIPSIPLSITAFMGNTIKGPVNTPTRIQSLTDFNRTFGGLWEQSPMSYAINQYFNNGGADSYVMRVTAPDAATSYAELACPGKLVLLSDIPDYELETAGKAGVTVATSISIPTKNATSFDLTVTRSRADGQNDIDIYSGLNTLPGDSNNIHTRLATSKASAIQVMPNTQWPTLAVPAATTAPITRESMNATTGEIIIPIGEWFCQIIDSIPIHIIE
ncbi:MAG: hypothetical protein JKY24_05800 [Pseudomonadales bacterium]|nr:hypothetical protein [Pseudomonadales bacterium]